MQNERQLYSFALDTYQDNNLSSVVGKTSKCNFLRFELNITNGVRAPILLRNDGYTWYKER